MNGRPWRLDKPAPPRGSAAGALSRPRAVPEVPAAVRRIQPARFGEVRETADETLLSFQDLGPGSGAHLRETLGLPSCDGVRPR
jgi:hypothetical protein